MTAEEYRKFVSDQDKQRKRKYLNQKVYEYADGFVAREKQPSHGNPVAVYDSVKEYNRFKELLILEKAGLISNLTRQIPLVVQEEYVYHGKVESPIIYRADHVYDRNNEHVIEDVKPLDKDSGEYRLTKDFSMKWKILKSKHPDWKFELY